MSDLFSILTVYSGERAILLDRGKGLFMSLNFCEFTHTGGLLITTCEYVLGNQRGIGTPVHKCRTHLYTSYGCYTML